MVYLDNAGTTKVIQECMEIYSQYQEESFYNPSAPYHEAFILSEQIKKARESILRQLKGKYEDKFIFTSSGSESDNMVLFGAKKSKNGRIIVSESEHPAVYNAALELKNRGYDVVFCDVDETGRVIEERFQELLTPNTDLISVMHVNNETGCVNDIRTLVSMAKSICPNVLFHSDGVQAVGKVPVSLRDLGVDAYTVSGHKIHGVKGTAGLYIKSGCAIKPLIYGGGQEFGLRSSTENVGGIVSLAKAIRTAVEQQASNEQNIKHIRNELKAFLSEMDCHIVDAGDWQSSYILCAALPHKLRGEVMLHSLEKYGILIGTGSACSSKKTHKKLPKILNLPSDFENGIIRLSFSRFTGELDVVTFKNCFKKEYFELLRYIS